MKVFLTGASGYIGNAILQELAAHGHEVSGLARSDEAARAVRSAHGTPVLGDLLHPHDWRDTASRHEAIIHTAMDYEGDTAALDRGAFETLLDAGTKSATTRVLVYTSGCWALGDTGEQPAAEDASTGHAWEGSAWRAKYERTVLAGDSPDLAVAIVRPGMVYGGKGGLFPMLYRSAVEEGAVRIPGDGENRWSCVWRDDLAGLYRLIAERHARGIFHGVDGTPVRLRDVAEAIANAAGSNGKVRATAPEKAREEMGPMADAFRLDQALAAPASHELGWTPQWISFLDHAGDAFEAWRG